MTASLPSAPRRRWRWILLVAIALPLAYRVGLTPIPCGRSFCLPLQACLHVEGPGTIAVDQPSGRFELDRCVTIAPGQTRYSEAMQPSQSSVRIAPSVVFPQPGDTQPENIDQVRSEASQRNVRALEEALTRARGSMQELPPIVTALRRDWTRLDPVAGMAEGEQLLRATPRDSGVADFFFIGRAGLDYRLFASAPRKVTIVRLVPDLHERRVKVASCGDGLGGAPRGTGPLEMGAIRIDVADVGGIELREESYSYEKVTEFCDNPLPMP